MRHSGYLMHLVYFVWLQECGSQGGGRPRFLQEQLRPQKVHDPRRARQLSWAGSRARAVVRRLLRVLLLCEASGPVSSAAGAGVNVAGSPQCRPPTAAPQPCVRSPNPCLTSLLCSRCTCRVDVRGAGWDEILPCVLHFDLQSCHSPLVILFLRSVFWGRITVLLGFTCTCDLHLQRTFSRWENESS